MTPDSRKPLIKLLTAVYLIATFFVTAATSKSDGGGPSITLKDLGLDGITNYRVQSNCAGRPDVNAIRVQSGAITESISSAGIWNAVAGINFKNFSFPNETILVGMDQTGSGDQAARKCIVRGKQSDTYDGDQKKSENYWFMKPGYLTTVFYECSGGDIGTCSVVLSELPAGDLRSSLQYQKL